MFFRQITIRSRLILGFGFLMILIAVMSLIALSFIRDLSSLTIKLYNQPFATSTALLRIDANAAKLQNALKSLVMTLEAASISGEDIISFQTEDTAGL